MSSRDAEIFELYKAGKTLEKIALEFKVTRSRIQQIIGRHIGIEVQERLGISIKTTEGKALLRVAVKKKISEIVQIRNAQNQNQKTSKNSTRIKTKLAEIPNLANYVTLSSLARAIGENVADLKLYAPETSGVILAQARRKWSRNYLRCRNCGTTSIKHKSYGLCEDCYPKSELYKEVQKSSRFRNYEKWKVKMREYIRAYKNRPYVIEKMKIKNDLKFFGGNRAKALIRDNFTCQYCGRTQEESIKKFKRDLYVNHIKGPNNHELENLITSCQGCHIIHFRGTARPFVRTTPQKETSKVTSKQDQFTTIIELVADAFGIPQKNILSDSRRKEFVMPRHVAMYLLKKIGAYSYPKIGAMFGRDHTSIMHAEKHVRKYSNENQRFNSVLLELEKNFAAKAGEARSGQ